MKKLLVTICIITGAILTCSAQEISKNAIGIRFGDNNGIGAEVSYQRRLSGNNRLEIDLGIRGNSDNSIFKATGLYQWVWQLENNFNWYAGFGGGILSANGSAIFGAGVIGVEYNFDIPLLISLDFRPEFGITGAYYDGFNSDFGLGVRYQF